jgi:hypothetical protein
MQQINHRPRGFFTFAQNTDQIDYVRHAYGLALSLKYTQVEVPYLSIGITPGTTVDEKYAWAFDNIIEIYWKDDAVNSKWKLENEWKSIWMSPYEETIKLDCDMLFFTDISLWWQSLSDGYDDMVFANMALNWTGAPVTSDYYRKVFTKNQLPNVYSAFTYFRKSKECYDFFTLASYIFWNWQTFFEKFLIAEDRPNFPSTDVIYALAAKILDDDGKFYTPRIMPVFTHMKSQLQGWNFQSVSDDWQDHISVFFNPEASCSLGHHKQFYPLHYHIKSFLTDDMIKIYENLVKNEQQRLVSV